MTDTNTPSAANGDSTRRITEYLAGCLTHGPHPLNESIVSSDATIGDDGYITVDLRQWNFAGPDAVVRVLLHPTAPVTVTDNTEGVEIGVAS